MKNIYYYLLMAAILCMVYIKSGAQTPNNYIKIENWKPPHRAFAPIDTPKLKTYGEMVFFTKPLTSVEYGSQGFRVIDSTGTLAIRDTSGNWVIKDAARSLEVMFQLFIQRYKIR